MTSAKKVLVLYSTGGMGHKKAAMALETVFKDFEEEVQADAIDVLEYGNRLYRFIYEDLYVYLMSKAKPLWGALYELTNNRPFDVLTRKIRGVMDLSGLGGLDGMLIKSSPDAIVATHFLLPSIAELLKEKGLRSKLFTLVTDYGPHTFWLSDYVDMYFVGSEPASAEMAKRGIPPEKIKVTGIPTTADFMKTFDVENLRHSYGLHPGKKTVFLMTGGFGVGPMSEIMLSLNSCRADIQVIAVCGRNEEAYRKVSALRSSLTYPTVLFAFTEKIAELMSVSDIMVTKAGGISVTEAMNSRLPMIIFASVPGQETWNERFLAENHAAEKAGSVGDIPLIADRMLLSEDTYALFMEGIDKIRRPDAAREIVSSVIEEITRNA